MLAGSARITRASTPLPFSRSSISCPTTRVEGRTTRSAGERRGSQVRRELPTPQASFLETLFSGGSSSKTGAKAEADEMVSELLERMSRRGRSELIGPNEEIDGLIDAIKGLNVARNTVRSPMLPGLYKLAYTERKVTGPPGSYNPTVTITEDMEVSQEIEIRIFGLFPVTAARAGSVKMLNPNAIQMTLNRIEEDKGFMGSETRDLKVPVQLKYDIAYLDERALVAFATKLDENGMPVGDTLGEIWERVPSPETEEVEKEMKSSISVGGLPGVSRKESPATKAERTYQKREAESSALAAEKEAREEALRLEKEKAAAEREAAKEKAAAEREAALALKAEIKASVDSFGLRMKEAQESKKEAIAALRAFERENTSALKEVKAFKNEMDSMTGEIEGLVEETQQMAADEKRYAEEIKECRREITALQQKLAAL